MVEWETRSFSGEFLCRALVHGTLFHCRVEGLCECKDVCEGFALQLYLFGPFNNHEEVFISSNSRNQARRIYQSLSEENEQAFLAGC